MKKGIIATIIALLLGGSGYVAYDNLGATDPTPETLFGSSALLCKVPISYVLANSTSTAGLTDGCLVQQQFVSRGLDKITINASIKAGTATSTFSLWQQSSNDGVIWYDIISATTTEGLVGTTTLPIIPKVLAFDAPSANATTTFSRVVNVEGAAYTRFLFLGEDVSTDPNDGVRAWIEIIKHEQVN